MIVEEQTENREEILRAEFHRVDDRLSELRAAMRSFRKKNFAFRDGHLAMIADRAGSGQATADEWRSFCTRDLKLVQERNRLLQEWSRERCQPS